MEVDVPRKRIALSMKSDPFGSGQTKPIEQKSTTSTKPASKTKISSPSKAESIEDKLAQLKNKFKS
jgi:uncharacterized protein